MKSKIVLHPQHTSTQKDRQWGRLISRKIGKQTKTENKERQNNIINLTTQNVWMKVRTKWAKNVEMRQSMRYSIVRWNKRGKGRIKISTESERERKRKWCNEKNKEKCLNKVFLKKKEIWQHLWKNKWWTVLQLASSNFFLLSLWSFELQEL